MEAVARGGVPGLYRRPRKDRGKPRKKRDKILARRPTQEGAGPPLGEGSQSDPQEGVRLEVPRSTLYRHLRLAGATRRKLGVSSEKVRCRWTRDRPDALWVGDFEHGPLVMHQGRAVKTHLSAWIDCHSRYIVEARYYIRENLDILIDSLLRAWERGASRELYVDNAKIYHAKALRLACTQLNIKLLHRPPRDPAAGGLIERFFQTIQGQLEAEVRGQYDAHAGRVEPRTGRLACDRLPPVDAQRDGRDAQSAMKKSPASPAVSTWEPCWSSSTTGKAAGWTRISRTSGWTIASSPSIQSFEATG